MRSTSSSQLAVGLCAATLVAAAQPMVTAEQPRPAPRPPQAEPTLDLSPIAGLDSCGNALNELGTVVGIRRTEYGIVYGFSWSKRGGLVDLDVDTSALAVNDHGEIAGHRNASTHGLGAQVWTRDGAMDIAYGVAYSLNNRTEVVGFHFPPTDVVLFNHAFRWTPEGGLEDVESLDGDWPPWSFFAPLAITRFIRADGVMAGQRGPDAVLWSPDGHVTTLGPGIATSVNDLGVVAGTAWGPTENPVVWQGGPPTVITENVGEALDINTAGYVVGWMMVGGERHGFVWHAGHGLQDLGSGEARSIDEIGDVAGCLRSGGESRATVWQVRMTGTEYLVGFESLARRLLADVDAKAARAVFREIRLAQKALERSHGKIAARHLERAGRAAALLARSGQLPQEWAAALGRVARWIAGRL